MCPVIVIILIIIHFLIIETIHAYWEKLEKWEKDLEKGEKLPSM